MKGFLRLPPKRYLLAGIALYGVFLVALLPATWVSQAIFHYSRGSVDLRLADGYWWKGHSQQVILGKPATGQSVIGVLTWQWQPKGVVKGTLVFDLAVTGATPGRMLLTVGRTGMRLEARQGDLPLDGLQQAMPRIKVIKGTGHAGNP
jgi:hypothetical protein